MSLSLQDQVKILGVSVDYDLCYDHHDATVALQSPLCISALCRMGGNLNPLDILKLCKANICPCIEYGALSWMSIDVTHMQRPEVVLGHALRLVGADGH